MSISYEKHGAETIEWLLEYLSAGGPDQIDGDDYEIVGEDEQGREGGSDISISGLAGEAAKAIRGLRQRERALIEANEAWEREHDDVKLARDAALQREQALAAQVERLIRAGDALRHPNEDGCAEVIAWDLEAEADPATSLARLKAQWQAEAVSALPLEDCATLQDVLERKHEAINELRRQAEQQRSESHDD